MQAKTTIINPLPIPDSVDIFNIYDKIDEMEAKKRYKAPEYNYFPTLPEVNTLIYSGIPHILDYLMWLESELDNEGRQEHKDAVRRLQQIIDQFEMQKAQHILEREREREEEQRKTQALQEALKDQKSQETEAAESSTPEVSGEEVKSIEEPEEVQAQVSQDSQNLQEAPTELAFSAKKKSSVSRNKASSGDVSEYQQMSIFDLERGGVPEGVEEKGEE